MLRSAAQGLHAVARVVETSYKYDPPIMFDQVLHFGISCGGAAFENQLGSRARWHHVGSEVEVCTSVRSSK